MTQLLGNKSKQVIPAAEEGYNQSQLETEKGPSLLGGIVATSETFSPGN